MIYFMNNFESTGDKSGKIKGYLCVIFAAAVIALCITAVILGYFVSFKDSSGEIRDGFGRLLDEVPAALSMILPQWSGHIWLILDCMILLGAVIFIDRLFIKSRIYFKGVKNVDF